MVPVSACKKFLTQIYHSKKKDNLEKNLISFSPYKTTFLLLIGITLIISYQNSLSGPFVFDDIGNITNNPYIRVSSFSAEEFNKIISPYQPCKNRVIANLSFAINYYLGGLNPVGFHFVNILIHLITSFLVYALFQWYFQHIPLKSTWISTIIGGFAALLWATNPIHTNAVTYIVQRMTSLSTMFCLASLLIYLQARSTVTTKKTSISLTIKIYGLYTISCLFWILAILSKEIAAIFPLLLLAHELYFFNSLSKINNNKKKLIIAGGIFAPIGIAIFFLGFDFIYEIFSSYNNRSFTIIERLLTEPRVVFYYISLFLFPIPSRLSLYHDNFSISQNLLNPATTSFSIIGTFIWIILIILLFKRHKLLSFGLLWVFLTLLIESSFIALEIAFEHRFYMPSIGLVIIIITLAINIFDRLRINHAYIYLVLFVVITSQMLGTHTRNIDWESELTLAYDQAKKSPDSKRALTNLAVALIKKGRPYQAESVLQKVLYIDKNDIFALVNIFFIYINKPYENEIIAEKYLNKIVKAINSGKYLPMHNQGIYDIAKYLFQKQKRYADSLFFLEKVSLTYKTPDILTNIALCNMHLNKFNTAISYLKEVLKLKTHNWTAEYYLAICYKELGQLRKAKRILSDLQKKNIQHKVFKNLLNSQFNELQLMHP